MNKQVLILLLFALAAYGQQQERIAIIQTVDDRDSIGFSELAHLTDRLRETAVNVLPKQRYGVMTTESIVAFLGSQENATKICKEASCLAELGRKVNADYVAQARIGRFGGNLTIKTELYNVKSGNLVGSFTGNSKDIFGLLALIDEKASDLFRKMQRAPRDSKDSPVAVLEKAVDYELDNENNMPEVNNLYAHVPEKPIKNKKKWFLVPAYSLGSIAILYAVYQNELMKEEYDKYNKGGQSSYYYEDTWREAETHRSNRNMFYVIGYLILATGIGVHIWF